MEYLVIIQARLGSIRFPNKVMQTVGGIPMVKRVFNAAKASWADKVIVAWPERYPHIDESNVWQRFVEIVNEFKPKYIIRLTADCPLITHLDINNAISEFKRLRHDYYNNRKDGYDVQIFTPSRLMTNGHRENVINDTPNLGGPSVNTKAELAMVRKLVG
jgi:spore coat polysaccharide biosynthesis protein SpsF (cytidylyltransferase family)